MRNGFGTYSIPTEDGGYTKQYSGGWKDNKKHVCMVFEILVITLFILLSYCFRIFMLIVFSSRNILLFNVDSS